MVIFPYMRYGDFYCFLTPISQGRLSRNEEWSLYQTLSVCYWTVWQFLPISPATETLPSKGLGYWFGWVSNKSKIWPKMVILPHPRYGDFNGFRLLFNSSLKGSYLKNEERSLYQTLSVCYWNPMSMFGWVWRKSKIWPKMVILPYPRYGDFYCFLTSPSQGRLSRTKNDLLTKLGQCATEALC